MKSRALLLSGLSSGIFPLSATAQTGPKQVMVYGTLPGPDIGLAPRKCRAPAKLAVYQNGVRLNKAFGTLYKAC